MAHALLVASLQDGSWEVVGHATPGTWLADLGRLASWTLAVLVVVLLVRAALRQRRYRAVGLLGEADREAVRAAVTAAERRTVGEVLPVVLERSDRHPGAAWVAGLAFLVLGSACLAPWLPWNQPFALLLSQLLMGAVGFGAARALPDFGRLFVREARATEVAEEQAFQEFYRQGLHRTAERTGVLLFVSLFERRVVVLGDEGIDAVVAPELWRDADAAILRGIAAGSLRDGLLAGIRCVADVLAEHFPWAEGDRNEILDRFVVRAE